MTRYFKVVDDDTIDAFSEKLKERRKREKKGREWAEKHGIGEVLYREDGLFGSELAGFNARTTPDNILEKCTKAKRAGNYLIVRPKKTGDREFYGSWAVVCSIANTRGSEFDDIVGFNELSFFPARPGVHWNIEHRFLVWKMPDHVTDVDHCVEITNVEYLEAVKAIEADEK